MPIFDSHISAASSSSLKTEIHNFSLSRFNSFVKKQLLSKFNDSKWLVDLAGGHGQDMFRLSDAKIKNALKHVRITISTFIFNFDIEKVVIF